MFYILTLSISFHCVGKCDFFPSMPINDESFVARLVMLVPSLKNTVIQRTSNTRIVGVHSQVKHEICCKMPQAEQNTQVEGIPNLYKELVVLLSAMFQAYSSRRRPNALVLVNE